MRTKTYRGVMIEYRDDKNSHRAGGWYILNGPTYSSYGTTLPEPPYDEMQVERIIDDILDDAPRQSSVVNNPNMALEPGEKMSLLEKLSKLSIFSLLMSFIGLMFTPANSEWKPFWYDALDISLTACGIMLVVSLLVAIVVIVIDNIKSIFS